MFQLGPLGKITEQTCDPMNCIHGDCSPYGKCICHDGWTSEYCNQSLIMSNLFLHSLNTYHYDRLTNRFYMR